MGFATFCLGAADTLARSMTPIIRREVKTNDRTSADLMVNNLIKCVSDPLFLNNN